MMKKKSTVIVLIFITALVSTIVQANPSIYPGYAKYQSPMKHSYAQRYQQQTASPVNILEHSINNVLQLLSQQQPANIDQLKNLIIKEVAVNFDFDYMSKWVAGKRYYKMDKKQQTFFKNKFTEIFLSTFINKLTKDSKSLPRASQFQSKRLSQNEARASVMFSYKNGLRVKVEFRFFQTARGWKVVDVKANGISALMYFRSYFAQLIKERERNNLGK